MKPCILPSAVINNAAENEKWEAWQTPQRMVPIAFPVSGSGGREEGGRETGTVKGFEPSVRKPR